MLFKIASSVSSWNSCIKKLNLINIKLMLHGTIFNDNSHRNGLPNQSNLAQLHLHCESSLKIVPCNISFICNGTDYDFIFASTSFAYVRSVRIPRL